MNEHTPMTEAPKRGHNSLRVEGRITCTTRDGVQIDFPILYDKPYNTDEPDLLRAAESYSLELIELLITKPFALELAWYFRRRVEQLLAEAAEAAGKNANVDGGPTFNDHLEARSDQSKSPLAETDRLAA
jgi:hypothetical protein